MRDHKFSLTPGFVIRLRVTNAKGEYTHDEFFGSGSHFTPFIFRAHLFQKKLDADKGCDRLKFSMPSLEFDVIPRSEALHTCLVIIRPGTSHYKLCAYPADQFGNPYSASWEILWSTKETNSKGREAGYAKMRELLSRMRDELFFLLKRYERNLTK